MTQLVGFITVILRGAGLVAFSGAVGGAAFAFLVLRPFSPDAPIAALRRSLRLIALGGLGVGAAQLTIFAFQTWALVGQTEGWPIWAFLTTDFARVGLARAFLAFGLAATAERLRSRLESRRAWALLTVLALLLAATSGWLSHALGRLDGRGPLIALDALHQLGAAVWVGGLIHLIAWWPWRRRSVQEAAIWPIVERFSTLAMASVAAIVASGIGLATYYVGSMEAFVVTAYGAMVLTKAIVLAAAMILGALNFLAVRRARHRLGEPPRLMRGLVEAEIGLGVAILLAAASLTSLPPAVDVSADRATVIEVGSRFLPRVPRLASPPLENLLAVAAPISDTLAERKPEEYAWSEYNHHMSGLFVLVAGLLALIERWRRGTWARHWPLVFLGLATFMFFRNDPRAWPLGPAGFWETMLNPGVLQHRIAVLLVVALALLEWLVRVGRMPWPRAAYALPLLCATGGALLLTHSHSNFSMKAAFLLEITHSPLGILGVFVGWGRWLELRLPAPENRIPGRVWTVSLILLGAILLTYREG